MVLDFNELQWMSLVQETVFRQSDASMRLSGNEISQVPQGRQQGTRAHSHGLWKASMESVTVGATKAQSEDA
jgi:hypothetical protein